MNRIAKLDRREREELFLATAHDIKLPEAMAEKAGQSDLGGAPCTLPFSSFCLVCQSRSSSSLHRSKLCLYLVRSLPLYAHESITGVHHGIY